MRKFGFLVLSCLIMVVVWSFSVATVSAQEVKIPYVVSMGGWWTGIAITNDSDDPIDDMSMSFITDKGKSCSTMPNFKTSNGDRERSASLCVPYIRTLDVIAPHAILINTVEGLFNGSLPSNAGSVVLSSENGGSFSVTVYIGSPSGFAYQVFHSE